jgi:hypothetical protein
MYPGIANYLNSLDSNISTIMSGIFVCEIALEIVTYGKKYFTDILTVADFFLVIILLTLSAITSSAIGRSFLKIFKLLKVLIEVRKSTNKQRKFKEFLKKQRQTNLKSKFANVLNLFSPTKLLISWANSQKSKTFHREYWTILNGSASPSLKINSAKYSH